MEPENDGLEDDFPFQLGDFSVPCESSRVYVFFFQIVCIFTWPGVPNPAHQKLRYHGHLRFMKEVLSNIPQMAKLILSYLNLNSHLLQGMGPTTSLEHEDQEK